MDRQPWEKFTEMLKKSAGIIDAFGDELDENDRAEWYRYQTRLMRWGFERFVENRVTASEQFSLIPWRVSIMVQSPDQDHLLFDYFDTSKEYIVKGNRGSVPYFTLNALSVKRPDDFLERDWVAAGTAGLTEYGYAHGTATTRVVESTDLKFEDDGTFEIGIGKGFRPGNWVEIDDHTTAILIRVMYFDRSTEIAPTFTIESNSPKKWSRITPLEMESALIAVGQLVLSYNEATRIWWKEYFGPYLNQMRYSAAFYSNLGGATDRAFAFGAWKKEKDEALVFRFASPDCEYWNLQMLNLWHENLDNYEGGQGYATKFNTKVEEDGSVLVIFSEEDPAIGGKWLDSGGVTKGIMGLRILKTSSAPDVMTYRVPLAELKSNGLAALTPESGTLSYRETSQ